jgi:hypothetical protein
MTEHDETQTRTALLMGVDSNNDFVNFMGRLVERDQRDMEYITQSLMDRYKDERDRALAELSAIRTRMTTAFASGCMPTESRIMDILYPSEGLIQVYLQGVQR